ncbi:GatB/YqeY domain-containing protein [Geopsychrobacter electrodiphilus]|uniref:GatB/YqeY domain-containing protein n=1 Tax=Geopsychrobacter electrodiphilus TaxID=225196 RepID=UPI00035F7A0B|nr:GatB/YqeY domain-containing protein [Geopsychrobacter electrodiphilus]
MSLQDQLNNDMKDAMRAKDTIRLGTIRQLRSAIKNKEIETGKPLEDDAVIGVITTQCKQRREASQMFRDNARLELAEKEDAELVILQAYLPTQLDEAELRAIISEIIARVGATSPQDMGKVMGPVMAKTRGCAEGKLVNQLVKELLAG